MKRSIQLILCLIPFSAIAQLSIGPKMGISMANVSTPDIIESVAPDFRNLPGFEAGIVSEYRLSDRLSLVTELNYREKGFRMREDFNVRLFDFQFPVGATLDTRFRYLEVPVLGKLFLQKDSPVSLYVFGGPTLSYAMSGKIKARANLLLDLDIGSVDIDLDRFNHNRWEFGALAGLGTEFRVHGGDLFMDFRYHHGFSDLYDLPIVQTDIRHHSFGFGVGYRIRL